MARKASFIKLTEEDRSTLTDFVKTGMHSSRSIQRSQILLLNDKGQDIKSICSLLTLSLPTVGLVLSRYRNEGLTKALSDRPRSGSPSKITEEFEAHVTALACTDAPEGRSKWTIELLQEKVIQLKYIDTISDESIRNILKKVNLNLGRPNNGVSAI